MVHHGFRRSTALGAALSFVIGATLGIGLWAETDQPSLASFGDTKLALLGLDNLRSPALSRLHLSDISARGLRAVGVKDLKDKRLELIRLSDLRDPYLRRVSLDQLSARALEQLSVADVHGADWFTTAPTLSARNPRRIAARPSIYPPRTPLLPQRGDNGPLHEQSTQPVPGQLLPLHAVHAKSLMGRRERPDRPATKARRTPPRYFVTAPKARGAPAIAYHRTHRRSGGARVYAAPRRYSTVERDIAFAPRALPVQVRKSRIKVFASKLKAFVRDLF